MRRLAVLVAIPALLAVVLGAPVPSAAAGGGSEARIFWTDANWWGTAKAELGTANADGTKARALVRAEAGPPGAHQTGYVAVDPQGRYVYWARQSPDTGIRRIRMDGTGEDWVITTGSPFGVAVSSSRVYWTDDVASTIARSRIDGSHETTLVTGLGVPDSYIASPHDIAIDEAGGKLYWTATALNVIQRSNLDGTGVETIATTQSPMGIGLDLVHGNVYWATGCIYRVPLAGGTPATVLCTGLPVIDVAVDGDAGELYWTQVDDQAHTGEIRRAHLDGSAVELLLSKGLAYPWGIAVANVKVQPPAPSRNPVAPPAPETSAAPTPRSDSDGVDIMLLALLLGALAGGFVSLTRRGARVLP